ncbi:MAG: SDR family NAD(P)-dependent oxidoreductase, partial [Porticoccaceae bacterium]|nr:SDR family NAD(P)-dependent oxidoreductase [Porticoccaceae bacterium]
MSERPAALVTGGAIRVGLHFARTLAAKGYDVAIHYNSSSANAETAATEIRSLGVRCEIFPWDFLSGQDPSGLIDAVAEVFPRLSVLVNCASIYNAAPVAETTMAMLQNEFMVNFFTPFLLS